MKVDHDAEAPIDGDEVSPRADAIDRLTAVTLPASRGSAGHRVGLCIDELHPSLVGRVRCRFESANGNDERWVCCLQGVRPRVGDRVLVVGLDDEPIVIGVVDGFRERAPVEPRAAHVRRVRPDEVVRIEADDGRGLIELSASDQGPVVRFLSKDVRLDAEGTFEVSASAVKLVARQGAATITASEDVVMTGEHIHLN